MGGRLLEERVDRVAAAGLQVASPHNVRGSAVRCQASRPVRIRREERTRGYADGGTRSSLIAAAPSSSHSFHSFSTLGLLARLGVRVGVQPHQFSAVHEGVLLDSDPEVSRNRCIKTCGNG